MNHDGRKLLAKRKPTGTIAASCKAYTALCCTEEMVTVDVYSKDCSALWYGELARLVFDEKTIIRVVVMGRGKLGKAIRSWQKKDRVTG